MLDSSMTPTLQYRQCIFAIETMRNSALRRLDLNLLLVLHTVLETRNVTTAALRLNMSQPAVSRAIGRLRVVFDDPLFTKGAGGVVATPRAEALSDSIATLLADIEAAVGPPHFDASATTRVFRIATTDYGALAVIPALAADLAVAAPRAGIDVVPFGPDAFRSLAAGEIDFVFYTDDPIPAGLSSRPLFDESYASLVREGHPMLQGSKVAVDLDAFLAFSHILVTVFGGRTGVVDVELEVLGHTRHVAVSVPYFATAALIAARSDLVLTLPRKAIKRLAEPHKLIVFPTPVKIQGYNYRLIWHPRSNRDPGHKWLMERAVAATLI
jgi:DNA-binding transcriptional LysR family regulator